MDNILISAKNISKAYSDKGGAKYKALDCASVDIYRNDSIAVIGHSGAGKSTLLHILGSLDIADSGELCYSFDNEPINISKISSNKLADIRNKKIGFVFQFHYLLPEFTVLENVALPALIAKTSESKAKALASELLKQIGILDLKNKKATALSGGEQQRAAIARALINSPAVLFADEPTGNLDGENSKAVLNLLEQLKREYSLTVVIATHSDEVANFCSKTIKMADGKIIG